MQIGLRGLHLTIGGVGVWHSMLPTLLVGRVFRLGPEAKDNFGDVSLFCFFVFPNMGHS